MSGDIDLYNINDVCRLCLKCDGTILPIFGLEHSSRDCIPLSSKIKACVSVEVSKNDELPKKICVGCVHQVDSWHKFKTICDNSQTKLRSWFKPQNASRASQQIPGEVKQEFVDIDDNDVICCDDELDDDFNNDVSMPIPECDVILVEDDVDNGDDDDDDDDDVVMENDDAGDEDDVISTTENHSSDNRQNNRTLDESESVVYNKDSENPNESTRDTSNNLLTSVEKSSGNVDPVADVRIESGKSQIGSKKSSDKQVDDNSLRSKENEHSTSSRSSGNDDNGGIIAEEQRMLADFHDELAPDLQLSPNKVLESQVNGIDVSDHQIDKEINSTNPDKEEIETSIKVLKDKSSTIIDRISSEINRRLSSDDNLNIDYSNIVINGRNTSESDRNDNDSISNNDVDDSASIVNEEEEEEEEVVIEKRELRPRNRNQPSQDSAPNVSESGIVIVEGFSLSDYNSPVTNDVRRLHHHNSGNHNSSGPDLEMLGTFDSSHPNLEMLYNIKQEPSSPTAGNSSDINIKKEVEDWTSMPSEPIDIKPDITLLEGFGEDIMDPKGKRRKYPQFKNGIPCEPCKSSFPNYVKWIRHTKSHKHQRNVAFYDINRRSVQGSDVMNTVLPSVQNFIRPQRPLLAENRQNPCPIGGCQASFKHRRNLVTHVRTHHGYRLKDLEVKSPSPKANHAANVATASESTDNNVVEESNNDVVDESGDSEKKTLMKCSHCPKEFDSKVSLKTHLLMKHRISSISAKLKCDRCFKTFHRKTGLLSHMRSCGTSVKSRKCPYCLSAFQTYKETVQHKARCPKRYVNSGVQPSAVNSNTVNVAPNEDGTYSCEFCNITFEVQSVFYNHMEIYHSGSLDVSEQQPSNQETSKELQEKSVFDQDTSGNDINDSVFSADQDGDGKFSCRYCVKSFEKVEDLQDHISYHDINKIFQCKLCFATLNCKRYFQDHMRSHFIQHRGQYLCWTCFKPFNNRRDLTAHKTLHIKVKIYSCNLCKQTFSSILSLERHKRVHIDAGDGSGDRGDNESVKNDTKESDDVIEEVSYNLQEEQTNLICHICKKSFSSEAALEKHSKLHNPVKLDVMKKFVLTCSNCKVVFKTSSALRNHLQICKGSNDGSANDLSSNDKFKSLGGRVRCDKCHSLFATKLSLYKHRKYNRCPLFRTQYDTQYGTIKVYYCRYCKRSCQSVFGLYRHLKQCKVMQIKRRAAGVDANHCIKCRKQFSSLAVLFNHEKFCNFQRTGETGDVPPDAADGSKLQSLLSREFKCANCSTEFQSGESLSRHVKFCKVFGGVATEESSTGERFFSSCNVCGRKFNSSLSYKLHKKFCTGDGMPKIGGAVRCRGCGRPFSSKDRLRIHEKTCKLFLRTPVVMLSKPHQVIACSCGKVFASSSQLNAHKETCPQQNYEVSSATGSTSSVSSIKSVVKSNVLTCEYCFKKFGKYQARNSHMRICQVKLRVNPKNKKYPYHPKSTASVTITPHIPPSSNPYNCVVCKGTFSTEEELIDHSCHEYSLANNMEINNITVEPDIPQEILDMQPRQSPMQHQQQLQQQQIPQYLKSPKRVFKCYPCNKIFSGSSALSKHSQLFHGQSPATANIIINADGSARCPKCPRSFRDHKSLTHHMGWHTRQGGLETMETTSSSSSSFPPAEVIISPVEDVQPPQSQFSCSICFRKFLGKGPLQNHMRSHSNILSNQPILDDQDINSDLSANVKRPRGNNYHCKICPKVFKDKLSLINHHNLHKTVSPANSLKAKILSRAGKTYVSCNICHKILSSNSIPKHNKLHRLRQERPMFPEVSLLQQSPGVPKQRQPDLPTSTLFPCGFCFKLFRHQSSLNDHMIESHSYDEQPIPGDKRQSSQLQQQYQQPAEEEEDDDVVLIDEDEPGNEAASMTPTSGADEEEGDDGQENQYKCEICDKSWKHRSVYLRHVNAASHKELTKRLSDILTRVNHDVNAS